LAHQIIDSVPSSNNAITKVLLDIAPCHTIQSLLFEDASWQH